MSTLIVPFGIIFALFETYAIANISPQFSVVYLTNETETSPILEEIEVHSLNSAYDSLSSAYKSLGPGYVFNNPIEYDVLKDKDNVHDVQNRISNNAAFALTYNDTQNISDSTIINEISESNTDKSYDIFNNSSGETLYLTEDTEKIDLNNTLLYLNNSLLQRNISVLTNHENNYNSIYKNISKIHFGSNYTYDIDTNNKHIGNRSDSISSDNNIPFVRYTRNEENINHNNAINSIRSSNNNNINYSNKTHYDNYKKIINADTSNINITPKHNSTMNNTSNTSSHIYTNNNDSNNNNHTYIIVNNKDIHIDNSNNNKKSNYSNMYIIKDSSKNKNINNNDSNIEIIIDYNIKGIIKSNFINDNHPVSSDDATEPNKTLRNTTQTTMIAITTTTSSNSTATTIAITNSNNGLNAVNDTKSSQYSFVNNNNDTIETKRNQFDEINHENIENIEDTNDEMYSSNLIHNVPQAHNFIVTGSTITNQIEIRNLNTDPNNNINNKYNSNNNNDNYNDIRLKSLINEDNDKINQMASETITPINVSFSNYSSQYDTTSSSNDYIEILDESFNYDKSNTINNNIMNKINNSDIKPLKVINTNSTVMHNTNSTNVTLDPNIDIDPKDTITSSIISATIPSSDTSDSITSDSNITHELRNQNKSTPFIDVDTRTKWSNYENRKIYGVTKAFLKKLIYDQAKKLASVASKNSSSLTVISNTILNNNVSDTINNRSIGSIMFNNNNATNTSNINDNNDGYDNDNTTTTSNIKENNNINFTINRDEYTITNSTNSIPSDCVNNCINVSNNVHYNVDDDTIDLRNKSKETITDILINNNNSLESSKDIDYIINNNKTNKYNGKSSYTNNNTIIKSNLNNNNLSTVDNSIIVITIANNTSSNSDINGNSSNNTSSNIKAYNNLQTSTTNNKNYTNNYNEKYNFTKTNKNNNIAVISYNYITRKGFRNSDNNNNNNLLRKTNYATYLKLKTNEISLEDSKDSIVKIIPYNVPTTFAPIDITTIVSESTTDSYNDQINNSSNSYNKNQSNTDSNGTINISNKNRIYNSQNQNTSNYINQNKTILNDNNYKNQNKTNTIIINNTITETKTSKTTLHLHNKATFPSKSAGKGSATEAKEADDRGDKRTQKADKDYVLVSKRIDSLAKNYFKKSKVDRFVGYLNQDGRFTDLNYSIHGESEDLREHARRLGALTFWELNSTGNVSELIQNSFAFLAYEAPKITSQNWWLYVIGVPSNMWRAIFMARDYINKTVITDYMDRYFSKTKFGKVWSPEDTDGNIAGGNLGPRMLMGAVEHTLRGTLNVFLSQLREILFKEIVLREPYQGNGLRQDGCLHQHNQILKQKTSEGKFVDVILSQVYNNNYGKELLKNAAAVMWFFDGTKYDLGEELEESIFASFLECQQWLYRSRTVEPSSVGRFIDAGTIVTRIGGLDAVKRTLNFLQRVDRHRAEVVAALHRYYNVRPEKEFALVGNRHFFVSDLMAHQRRDFMASLRLLSSRTSRPETVPPTGITGTYFNGNSKGYYKGDGFLTILVTGNELGSFEREVFQVYDWARIPGVTCQYTKYVPEVSTTTTRKKHTYNEADFVGGVSNGKEGVAAMDYARPTVHLKAKKSWFFFDDVIVCLGSGISIPQHYVTGYSVTTTLNQVVYEGVHTVGFKNYEYIEHFNKSVTGRRLTTYGLSTNIWVHHGAIGYVSLIHDRGLGLEVEKRHLDLSRDSFITTFSLWLDHGVRPENATYAYALLPGTNFTETRNFANTPTVQVLNVTNSIHSICLNSSKILGLVFYERGCMEPAICLKNTEVKELCTDNAILMILKYVFSKEIDEETCPSGIESLPKDLKTRHIPNAPSEHQNSVLYYNSNNTKGFENVARQEKLKSALPFKVLQISFSDPTQKLLGFTLKLKTSTGNHFFYVSLPLHPRAGSSSKLCLRLN